MWLQGVLPEWMFPKDIGVLVSVKIWPQGQWLEISLCEGEVTDEVITILKEFKVPIKYTKGEKLFIINGSPEFIDYYTNYYYVKAHSNLLSPVSN
tara:strand:- start:85 stop:369 length:285 start_codon:yes stop_codon:yes gene_type:complete